MLTIIGCGNSNRCDDGVGVFVAQLLQHYLTERPRGNVRVFDAGTAGMDVMFQARGTQKLIIVDASKTGSEAGAIFKAPGDHFAADHKPLYNLHDFRWDHALGAGRKIFSDQFPEDVTVYLIESKRLDFGLELTNPVRESAYKVAAELQSVIDEYPPDAEK